MSCINCQIKLNGNNKTSICNKCKNDITVCVYVSNCQKKYGLSDAIIQSNNLQKYGNTYLVSDIEKLCEQVLFGSQKDLYESQKKITDAIKLKRKQLVDLKGMMKDAINTELQKSGFTVNDCKYHMVDIIINEYSDDATSNFAVAIGDATKEILEWIDKESREEKLKVALKKEKLEKYFVNYPCNKHIQYIERNIGTIDNIINHIKKYSNYVSMLNELN